MRISIIFVIVLIFFNLDLNGQTRNITGRVISEDFDELPGVIIQDIDTLLLGNTDIDGRFNITIPQEIDRLLFSWIGMEWTEIKLLDGCDTIEIVMLYDAIYDFISAKKIDRLRNKRFNELPNLHSDAVKNGLFENNDFCYERIFESYKPALDSINKELKLKRKQIKETYKAIAEGDTIRIPFSATWRSDGTDRTFLHFYSYVVDGGDFDCIIDGIITEKNKRNNGYNILFRVIDCKDCQHDIIILNGKEIKVGELIDYNMKYFKVLSLSEI